MRRNKTADPEKYIRVRLQMLYNEKSKNDDATAHLILDKSIFELSVVLDLITRSKQTDSKTPL
jgi:hypothetical protein